MRKIMGASLLGLALGMQPWGVWAANDDDDGLDQFQERAVRNQWIKIRDDRRTNIVAWYTRVRQLIA